MNAAASESEGVTRGVSYAYQLLMLLLCAYAILALAAGVVFPLGHEALRILQYADFAVCILFFADFLITLRQAPNKLKYLVTWGWIDLLSSVPMIDALRVGRVARMLRILRVLRALRATKGIVTYWVSRRASSAFFSVVVVSFSLIIFSSVAMLSFESGADGNIKTAEDALWWSFATITTVGYGDRFPVTTEGRAVAVMLMTAGVGLFGTLSGIVAAWFLAPPSTESEDEVKELTAIVGELRVTVEKLRELVTTNNHRET